MGYVFVLAEVQLVVLYAERLIYEESWGRRGGDQFLPLDLLGFLGCIGGCLPKLRKRLKIICMR